MSLLSPRLEIVQISARYHLTLATSYLPVYTAHSLAAAGSRPAGRVFANVAYTVSCQVETSDQTHIWNDILTEATQVLPTRRHICLSPGNKHRPPTHSAEYYRIGQFLSDRPKWISLRPGPHVNLRWSPGRQAGDRCDAGMRGDCSPHRSIREERSHSRRGSDPHANRQGDPLAADGPSAVKQEAVASRVSSNIAYP